jgi:uncharacterized membrane protein YbhN (UPF0104 family)
MTKATAAVSTTGRSWLRRVVSSTWFKVAVAAGVIGLLVHYNRIDVTVLASLSRTWPWLLAAFVLTLPTFLIVSYRFKIILASQGIAVPFRQALRWTMIGAFFDLAMPSSNGGDIVKAGYVVSYVGAGRRTRAVIAVGFDRVIGVLGLFLLASLASVIGWSMLSNLPTRDLVVATSFAAGIGPLIAFRIAGARWLYHNVRINHWLSSHVWGLRLMQLISAFNALREEPRILAAALGLSMLNHVFWCASLLLIAIAVGNAVAPIEGFVVFPLAIFAGVFGVAGGFGVGTAAFDFLLSNLLSIQNGAIIGLLFQILGALTRLTGLPFYLTATKSPPVAPVAEGPAAESRPQI